MTTEKKPTDKAVSSKIEKTLGDSVKKHTHAGVEYKAGDKIKLTQKQIDGLTTQFGDAYFNKG